MVETRAGWHHFDSYLGSSLIGWRSRGEGSHYRLLFWYLPPPDLHSALSARLIDNDSLQRNDTETCSACWRITLLLTVHLQIILEECRLCLVSKCKRYSHFKFIQQKPDVQCNTVTWLNGGQQKMPGNMFNRDVRKSMLRFSKHQIRSQYYAKVYTANRKTLTSWLFHPIYCMLWCYEWLVDLFAVSILQHLHVFAKALLW